MNSPVNHYRNGNYASLKSSLRPWIQSHQVRRPPERWVERCAGLRRNARNLSTAEQCHRAVTAGTALSSACMGKTKIEHFEVGCPCCGALLKVDPEARAVIGHTPPARPKTFNDFEEAARAMREQEGRKESLFRAAVDAEKNKASLMERKFQEAVKRAKDSPDTGKPLRDFDLD